MLYLFTPRKKAFFYRKTMNAERLRRAFNLLSNRFVGLEEPPAKKALETVYEAVENGEIKQCPCQVRVTCNNGQEATVVYPNSHQILTGRGLVHILKMPEEESDQASS
jgi:hypothetical protein